MIVQVDMVKGLGLALSQKPSALHPGIRKIPDSIFSKQQNCSGGWLFLKPPFLVSKSSL
jgi:hypothetical protein